MGSHLILNFEFSSSSSYTLSLASWLTSLINNEPLLDCISYFVSKIEINRFLIHSQLLSLCRTV
jgi:uncharacterized membrane protein